MPDLTMSDDDGPPALATQESDILVPPVLPKKRMNPVLALMLGMFVAALFTVGAVAAAVYLGEAEVFLPAELGGLHFPEAPTVAAEPPAPTPAPHAAPPATPAPAP